MVKVIANENPRLAIEELNSRNIKKDNIISIVKDNRNILIFYWEG